MKKYLFPLVMLSALLPCTAQDTVKWDDPWYPPTRCTGC